MEELKCTMETIKLLFFCQGARKMRVKCESNFCHVSPISTAWTDSKVMCLIQMAQAQEQNVV